MWRGGLGFRGATTVLIGRLRSTWVSVPGGSGREDRGGAVQRGRRGGEDGPDWWVQAISKQRRASSSRACTCGRAADMWGIVVGRRRARRLEGWRRQAGRDVRERRATRERMLATGRAGRAGPCGEEEKRAVLLGFAGKGSGPPGLGRLGWAGSPLFLLLFPFLFYSFSNSTI